MPRQPLGQNFLASERWAKMLVDALPIPADAPVLEIGPGKGALTRLLLEHGHPVTAIEKDADLAPHLRMEELSLFIADAAVFPPDIPAFAAEHGIRGLIGNLPYNVATRLFLRYLPHIDTIGPMILTFQKEVAGKILAAPGNRDYSALAVLAETWARREKIGLIPPGAFHPTPKVDSVAVRFTPIFSEPRPDFQAFSDFLHHCCSAPRKTLWNNLKEAFAAPDVRAAFLRHGLPPAVRPHQVDAARYRVLFAELKESAS